MFVTVNDQGFFAVIVAGEEDNKILNVYKKDLCNFQAI